MLVLALLALALFPASAAAADSVRQVVYQAETLTPANTAPTFDNGHLVLYGEDNVTVYAPGRSLAYRLPFPAKGTFVNVAVDTDRTAAAAVQYAGGRGGVSIFDSAGSQVRIIDTGAFEPSFVAFAPDHSLWTAGTEANAEYFILRHFNRDGKLLGASLPRSSFDERGEAKPIVGLSCLRVANNRVGLYLHRRVSMWVETDLEGKEIGRWPLDHGHLGAFTPSGAVYTEAAGVISVLDRAAGEWKPAAVPSRGHLLGSDREALVFQVRESTRLLWVPLPRP
jgi:hypothetical protein